MSIAQVAQVVAMAVILPFIFKPLGFQWTLAMGTGFWLVMFLVYARMGPRWLIVASMALHGLAFAFFDAALIYVERDGPDRYSRLSPGPVHHGDPGTRPVSGERSSPACDGPFPPRRQFAGGRFSSCRACC